MVPFGCLAIRSGLEARGRYLGIEVDDALALAEQVDFWISKRAAVDEPSTTGSNWKMHLSIRATDLN